MALVWVSVTRGDGAGSGDAFFIDRNYVDIAGRLGTPIKVRTGKRLFEIVGTDRKIAWQASHVCRRSKNNSETSPILVVLEAAPAEATP